MNRYRWSPLLSIAVIVVFLVCASSGRCDFLQVSPGRAFSFPRDHGAHEEYPIEWWYFTGHLSAENKDVEMASRTFGFELTFFRVGINQEQNTQVTPWHVSSLYLAHAAITDDQNQKFFFEKIRVRPDFRQAGASQERLEVWAKDWRVEQGKEGADDTTIHLEVDAKDTTTSERFSFSLTLNPRKLPVLQGKDGYSQKGERSGDASYYISFTRLEGKGEVLIGEESIPVTASAWMDHEILSSEPNSGDVGWDWFSIQLENNWECMLYDLKRGNPLARTEYSSGSCVSPEGEKIALSSSDFVIRHNRTWRSKESGIEYPAGWEVSIPKVGLDVRITPTVPQQELLSQGGGERSYWEGRCLVEGRFGSERQEGAAYVELVGYNS